MLKPALVTSALLIGIGCVSTPVSVLDATKAPPDRVLAFQSPTNESGKLIVTRDRIWGSKKHLLVLYLDGILAAKFSIGEIATFYLPPGEHVLKIGQDPESVWGGATVARETVLKATETKHFRITTNESGGIDIIRADL
jgi:hypothetical protein